MKRHLATLALLALISAPINVLAVDPVPPSPGPNEFEAMLKAHPPQPTAAPTIKPIALSKGGVRIHGAMGEDGRLANGPQCHAARAVSSSA